MRCDLHVHSVHSGPFGLPGLREIARECDSSPAEVEATARAAGMDLVTITDHDTIDGAVALMGRPGTFLSEEVTCQVEGGRVLHVGVFGLDERQHARISQLRRDAEAFFAFLRAERLPAALNHPFAAFTGPRQPEDLRHAMASLRLLETRNGALAPDANALAARLAERTGRASVGGSDAHTLAAVGRAWTEVPGARDTGEFLDGLRAGRTRAAGAHGGWAHLTSDVARLLVHALGEHASRAPRDRAEARRFALCIAMAGALPLLPAVTAGLVGAEWVFRRRLDAQLGTRWPFGSSWRPALADRGAR